MMTIFGSKEKLPREVWIASIDLKGLWPVETIDKRIKDILDRMENVFDYEPDIICLQEMFHTSWVREKKELEEIAESEDTPGPVTSILAEIAKKQKCYIITPLVTKKDGNFYNSSILIDREGKIAGVYHNVHPNASMILPNQYHKGGEIIPGPIRPPVFKTDFGKIGMMICYDAAWWFGSWRHLKNDGAEIVFFSSQSAYEFELKNHAWINQYYIVSSTGEDARIIDISGDDLASDGEFERWVCAPVNLEKILIHIWPHVRKFGDIREKYGRKLRIKIYHPENWATIESRDPDVKVKDVLKEFDIPTYAEHLKRAEVIQNEYRL